MEKLGGFLRAQRSARALTLGQLSLQSGVHKATLSRWEAGVCWPRVPELLRVLDTLRVTPAERMRGLALLEAPRAIVALRLGERYCALVADDPDEAPCRRRDFGNLLRQCDRPAESVAFISTLDPPDPHREGLKHLEIAEGLVALGARAEADRSLADARRLLAGMESRMLLDRIERLEHVVQ